VLPARWTTPGGGRPANPCSVTNPYMIFTPVLIEVEQYLKGQQPQRILHLFAYGGTVDRDQATRGLADLPFREGERVVVFLVEPPRDFPALNGNPLKDAIEHYTVAPDGSATDGYRTVPLQQLLDEIAESQKWP
jgi:hypothetical protein